MNKKCKGHIMAAPLYSLISMIMISLVGLATLDKIPVFYFSNFSGPVFSSLNLIDSTSMDALQELRVKLEVLNRCSSPSVIEDNFTCLNMESSLSHNYSDESKHFSERQTTLPPAINSNFIKTLACECPAVNESELSDILLTTWKICNEEKFHFMRALAQIRAESDFNPKLVSSAGARGLMQIMPQTGEFMNFDEVDTIENNIRCGIKYMKFIDTLTLHKEPREQWLASLASYNSGPSRYAEMARRADNRDGSTKWNYVAKSYRRRFRRVSGQKLPETLIYINRNLRSLKRFQDNLFESAPLANAALGEMVRISPAGRNVIDLPVPPLTENSSAVD
jgi:hypothetical protein